MGTAVKGQVMKLLGRLGGIVDSPRRAIVAVLVIAIAVRLIIGISTGPVLAPDSFVYYDWAKSISWRGRFWPIVSYRTPLYSAFLALFIRLMGQGIATGIAIVTAQYILGILSTVLVYRLSLRLFSPITAFVAAVLFTTSPLQLFYETAIHAETLFTFLFLCAVLMMLSLLRAPDMVRAALLGGVCGLLSLTRPVAQLLPFVFLGALLFKRLPAKQYLPLAALVLGVYGMTVYPWMQINKYALGRFTLAQLSGMNLFHRVIDIDRIEPSQAEEFADVRAAMSFAHAQGRHAGDLYFMVLDRLTKSTGSAITADDRMFGMALASLKQEPLKFVIFTVGHYFDLFFNPDRTVMFCARGTDRYLCSPQTKSRSAKSFSNEIREFGFKFRALIYHCFNFYHAVVRFELFVVLAVIGVVAAMRRGSPRAPHAAFLALVIGYFIFVTGTVSDADDRFRLPLDGLIFAFAAFGIEVLWRNRRKLFAASDLPFTGVPVLSGLFATLLFFSPAAAADSPSAPKEGAPIRIEVILPLTGDWASWGQRIRQGLELWRDHMKHKVEFVFDDEATCEAKKGVAAARKAFSEGIRTFIIGCVATTRALVPEAKSRGALLFSAGLLDRPSFAGGAKVVSMATQVGTEAEYLARYIGEQKFKTAGLVRLQEPFGEELAGVLKDELEKRGVKLLFDDNDGYLTNEFGGTVVKLMRDKPEAVVMNLGEAQQLAFIRKVRGSKSPVALLATYGLESNTTSAENRKLLEGVTYTYPWNSQERSAEKIAFDKEFAARYGAESAPNANSYFVRDGLSYLDSAYEQCKPFDTECVFKFFAGLGTVDGISGTVTFKPDGSTDRPYRMKRVVRGEFVWLDAPGDSKG